MKEKVMRFIKNNSVLKVLSLLLAFAIWFVIVSQTNPLEQNSLNVSYLLEAKGHQVETRNGITLMNTDSVGSRIEVTVKGRQESVTKVSSEDLDVSLDFSGVKSSGVQEVPVVVKSDKVGVSVVDYSPKTLSINFEKIVEATFPVTVNVEDEALQDGFVVAKTSVTPETIQLRGFESIISKISTVQVTVAAINMDTQIDQNKSFRMICKYYDAMGSEVTELDGIETVDVTITAGRVVALKPNYTGLPADDCYVKEVSITPKNVIVIGSSTTLLDLVSLDTTEVDITGETKDVTQLVDIVLPYGVTLADPSIRPMITIKLGGIVEKQFAISENKITFTGQAEHYVYTINSVSDLTLKGKDTTLESLASSSLKGSVNVTGLSAGTYELLVSVSGLPSGISVPTGGHAKVSVTIRETTVTTPEPTPSGTTAPSPTPDIVEPIVEPIMD